MVYISNEGENIVETNYWDSELAKKGLFFLSWNDGTARLLMPKIQENYLREIKSGKCVIITRGIYRGVESLEIMFEDYSESPFVIFLSLGQTDRVIKDVSKKTTFTLTVLTAEGEVARFPAKYRRAKKLPYMEPMKF